MRTGDDHDRQGMDGAVRGKIGAGFKGKDRGLDRNERD